MPLRVRMVARIPNGYFTENCFAVLHRSDLAIARAEVETNPAALPVLAQRRCGLALGRKSFRGAANELERPLVNLRAHDVGVEATAVGVAVMMAQLVCEIRRTRKVDFAGAARPKQKFQ